MKKVEDKAGWAEQADKKGVKVYQKTAPDGSIMLKGVGTIKAPAGKVLAVLEDIESRGKWDLFFDTGKMNKLTDTCGSAHLKFKSYYTVWARDFTVAMIRQDLENGSSLCIAESVVLPELPETSDCVRGTLDASGFLVEPLSETECRLTYILQIDLKGWIPTYLSNMVNVYQPLCIIGIRKLLTNSTDP
uniref:START domain-containing protein n=1 Tax=Arcella intermedia TaxID=1963864 RepID=A0A6B2LKP8_9EUKA